MLFVFQDLSVVCEFGFDGGHEANYHLELYEERNFLVNNITRPDPSFQLHHLRAGHDYSLLVYASNALGRSQVGNDYYLPINVRYDLILFSGPPSKCHDDERR